MKKLNLQTWAVPLSSVVFSLVIVITKEVDKIFIIIIFIIMMVMITIYIYIYGVLGYKKYKNNKNKSIL